MKPASSRRSALRHHGGEADGSIGPRPPIDFSVNVNPYGPHPAVVRAARTSDLARYPDPTASKVRRAYAERLDVGPESLVFANGAADLLWTMARALLGGSRTTFVVGPTFSEFEAAATACGRRPRFWRASAANGFAVDLEAAARRAAAEPPELLYLCNPNNPTGSYVSPNEIDAFARELRRTTIVVDQSFLSLSEHHGDARHAFPRNVVPLRSLTKDHALAGLRLGYLVAEPKLAARIEAARAPWSTSAPAQAAALAILERDGFLARCRERLGRDRESLRAALSELGLEPLPSSAPFFLVKVGRAALLSRRLLERHGIRIRDCTSFGLPRHVRLAARPAADRRRLVAALRAELSEMR